MEEKKKIFLPKGTEGRQHDIMVLHIFSIGLIFVLLAGLACSMGLLFRNVMGAILGQATGSGMEIVDELGVDAISELITAFMGISKAVGVLMYIGAFLFLGIAIVLLIFMRKRIRDIIDDPFPFDNPIRVKKAPYVWLGFLLGGYGGHYFYIKNKTKAWWFLGLGIFGTLFPTIPSIFGIPLLLVYTSSISFADAFLACFVEKDSEGYIEIENYPYWL